jgi:hypothetical protein
MSLSRMRRWSRVVAVMLLIAAARGTPHFAQDDIGCDLAILAAAEHDESKHGFRSSGDSGERDHCALCHWSRLLRSPLTALGVNVTPAAPAALEQGFVAPAPVSPIPEELPARAPPSFLL